MKRWQSLSLLCSAEILAMSTWFSATSVVTTWRAEFDLTDQWAALLTSSVSVGFALGAIALTVTGVGDRFDCRRIFALAAIVSAIANILSLVVPPTSFLTLLLRLLVGAAAAGIYPIGMRLASTWAVRDMGFLVGLLVGAQVFGLSLPHLIDAAGGLNWRTTIIATSAATGFAALLVGWSQVGPRLTVSGKFDIRDVGKAWNNRSIRLVNIGYLGHMWELFAMWAWISFFLQTQFSRTDADATSIVHAKYVAFASIAVGALGCILGGHIADRIGRTKFVIAALATSGGCALILALMPSLPLWLLSGVCILWGASVVADSPQFSAAVVELSPPHIAGTMLLSQVATGMLLTVVSIQIVPYILDSFGWSVAFIVLTLGPVAGIVAMTLLRNQPDANALANGKM